MKNMFSKISSVITGFVLIIVSVYLSSCDSKTGLVNPPPPPPPTNDTNIYGAGNGKSHFTEPNILQVR